MAQSVPSKTHHSNPAMDIPLRKARGIDEIRVTPEIAQHWLTFNLANRDVTQAKVDQFKADMESGNWKDDGATVRFAYGKLLDGQHRLKALLEAGVTVRMIVVFGLDSEAQVTMDTGRGRTPKDVLSIEGMDTWSSGTLGSAIHTIIAYETGRALYSPMKFTNREVRNFYLEHQSRIDASINVCKGYPRRHPMIPLSRVLALHYVFSKKDAALASSFFDRLMTGAELTKSSPIFFLRNLLDADLKAHRKRTTFDQICFIVKAWNTFRRGGAVKSGTYLYPRDNEAFPEIA